MFKRRKKISVIVLMCFFLSCFNLSAFAADTQPAGAKSAGDTQGSNVWPQDWLFAGDAHYDQQTGIYELTKDEEWTYGTMWYNKTCDKDFSIDLDYYTGCKDRPLGGADGIVVAFRGDYDYTAQDGGYLAFDNCGGYGIELDTYYNYENSDSTENHIALIKNSVSNHLVSAPLPESEDSKWHHLRVVVKDNICVAFVDGRKKLEYAIEETGKDWIGITAATATGWNRHAVKNIRIANSNNLPMDPTLVNEKLELKVSSEKISDSDSKLGGPVYKVRATLKNNAGHVAKNIDLKFNIDPNEFEVRSASNVNIGHLNTGETKEATWEIATEPTIKSHRVDYSVTATVEKAVSLTQYDHIYLPGKNSKRILVGRDNWNFYNCGIYFSNVADTEDYYMTDEDYAILNETWNSNKDRKKLQEFRHTKWDGSCYGMTVVTFLGKAGIMDPAHIQPGTSCFHEIRKGHDDRVESIINFYSAQQLFTKDFLNLKWKTNKKKIEIIEQMAKDVDEGALPFVLSMSLESGAGHSIIGYGVEYAPPGKAYLFQNKQYKGRILLADTNVVDKVTYMYFNPGTGEYSVENYIGNAYDVKKLTGACNDIKVFDLVNHKDAIQNRRANLESHLHYSYRLQYADEDVPINMDTDDAIKHLFTYFYQDITAEEVEQGVLKHKRPMQLMLPDHETDYTVSTEEKGKAEFELTYENYLLNAKADSTDTIAFGHKGDVALSNASGAYELSSCANEGYYHSPWYMTTITGKDSPNVGIQNTDKGIKITGDNLKDVKVTVTNETEEKEVTFSTDQKEVMVGSKDTPKDGKVPVILIDKDQNGSFETDLNEPVKPNPEPEKPDPDADKPQPKPDQPSSGNNTVHNYPVSLEKTEHGTITVDPKAAVKDETVTVKVTPDKGYQLQEIVVLDKNQKEVKVTEENGIFIFKMPASKVTVKAVFKKQLKFKDVVPGSWYEKVVYDAVEADLIKGMSEDLFGPEVATSRAMVVSILHRMAGEPSEKGDLFTDVPEDSWYAEPIRWAKANHVVGGFEDGSFKPEQSITREQMAVILYRYIGDPKVTVKELTFKDKDQISAYAKTAVNWAVEQGLLKGMGDNVLAPQGTVTRAQAAAILMRYYEMTAK